MDRIEVLEKIASEGNYVGEMEGMYHLVIWRHPVFGTLNGYIGVKRRHPLYRNMSINLSVHGGVTFTGKLNEEGFKKKFWYIGFDTAHSWDYVPILNDGLSSHYRDLGYVKQEVQKLLDQIKELEDPSYKPNYQREYKQAHKEKIRKANLLAK